VLLGIALEAASAWSLIVGIGKDAARAAARVADDERGQ
jgi:hypothetical protein